MPYDEPISNRLERARRSLLGLAVGDAFGGAFFWDTEHQERVRKRDLPAATWTWSDDTAMARAVFLCLDAHQEILPDALAALLAEEYHRDPTRGYGTNAHTVLDQIWQGVSWREAAGSVFEGTGSCGNGAAMRVGPVGAYFHDDIWRVRDEARRSALVTHAHPEGQAGAMAVAAAAAWASQAPTLDGRAMLTWAWSHTPEGATRSQLEQALALPLDREPEEAAALLGSGQKIISQDTVPFALWCAARHLNSYPEALWATVAGGGDMDTTCAIVGSIVVLCAEEGIPEEWLSRSEALTGLSRPAQTWWSKWDGMTVAKMMTPESVNYRCRMFSAAQAGDWSELFELLAQRGERSPGYTINAVRPNDSTWYTFLHYAALGNAPVEVVEKLLSKGHFRSIRCAAGERPVDIAHRLGHTHLVAMLEPTRKHDIPEEKLAPLQVQFHQLISEELSPFDRQHLRLPPLEVLLERDDLIMTFFMPSKFGGFIFRLQQVARPEGFDCTRNDWVLLAKNFDRMGDSEHFYLVTRYGYQLMSKGHED